MAIGNPINLTSNVEGKNISVIATAGQTQFTVTGGYRINQISVFRNGVRLVDGRDFTAADGATVTLLSAATVADVLEFQVFDDFRVSDALNVNSGGTVNGDVTVTGIVSTTNLSIGSSISLDATSGIVTAVQFVGDFTGTATTATNAEGLTGTPDITVNNIVAAAATFSGVLTYEDVTNIDSLGIVTARTGVDITANGLVVNAGVSTFGADLSIADKIIHSGDTNTAIRFPSNDKFTVETAGVQRLEVDSNGDLGLVGIATATGLVVVAGSGGYAGHTGIITAVTFDGALSGAATQVTVADESSDTTCFPLFVTAATGDLAPKSGTNLAFNSSSGRLDATQFNGNFVGGTVSGTTGTFSSDVDIADKIVHTGDTNTAIRFPAGDTFSVETGAVEALRVDPSQRLLLGTTTARETGSGFTSLFQIEGANTISSASASIISNRSADNLGARLNFARSVGGDKGDVDVVSDGNELGGLYFWGADGIDTNNLAASIVTKVDGTVTVNDIPGAIIFSTTPVSSTSPTERLRIDNQGRLLLGHTDNINNKFMQITTSNGAALGLLNYQATDDGPEVTFIKSRNGTKGSHTVVNNGDFLGRIFFRGSDGDSYERGVEIAAQVDGTPGDGDMPGRLLISTTADGASTPTERLRITSTGVVKIPDGGKFTCGTGDDLEIEHTGSGSFIRTSASSSGDLAIEARNGADLYLTGADDVFIRPGGGDAGIKAIGDGAVELYHNNSKKLETTSSGVTVTGTVSDSKGDLRKIIHKQETSAYTLVAADAGKAIEIQGNLTVPNSVFAAGDAITIINDSSSDKTISKGTGLTYMFHTADGTNANRTLGGRGMATIFFVNSTTCYISGSQLS